jgi:hypothetical protein
MEKRKTAIGVALGVLCVVEQGTDAPTFDKLALRREVASFVTRVPAGCEAVLFGPGLVEAPSYQVQIDAMFAASELGIPTVNGYSGNEPPGWELRDTAARDKLEAWARVSGLDVSHVCVIVQGGGDGH